MKHGGDLTEAKARHGAGDPPWLDLSTGINPQPWPVPDALRRTGWERLPSAADMDRLLDAAREAYRVPEGAAIVAAPGTQMLIQWLPRLAPPGGVATTSSTYGGHEEAWRGAGRGQPTRHRVVVNPNNPDGRVASVSALREAAKACAEAGGWLIVDEAFADLDPGMSASGLVPDLPVIVLRSFGKFYGLAGLRLGFAIASREIAHRIREALGDWAVSGPALAVGTAALADVAWADTMRLRLASEAASLDHVLGEAGLEPAGGTDLYRLVRHPDATALHERLAAAHIWCRRFDEMPDRLRFGLPPDAEALARLRAALAAHVQGTRIASPATSAR